MAGETHPEVEVEVGEGILVFWDGDQEWYRGEVVAYNSASQRCEILYDDGEREEVNLKEVQYRICTDWKTRLRKKRVPRGVPASTRQLEAVAKTLFDIDDRLPPEAVLMKNEKWWQAWHSRILAAAKSGCVQTMAKGALEIALQLKENVTTSWWTSEVVLRRLRNSYGCSIFSILGSEFKEDPVHSKLAF